MFKKILIANRGEIAIRIMRACRELGIETVAVYSEADTNALFVKYADEAYLIGPASASLSYLKMDTILDVAEKTSAEAIHPGYGFLSENSKFVNACAERGIVFIGPPASAIDQMGSKINARTLTKKAGVPVVPGTEKGVTDPAEAIRIADEIGYPVIVKASSGGGGIGMKIVRAASEMAHTLESTMSVAKSAFGDSTVFIEKYVSNPRHIEFQILADNYGNTIHVADRECSIQRRHQKLIEEAPSPIMTDELRARMGKAAVDAAKAVNYTNAGTIEFLYSNGEFYFLEMNTRLQVEHPITEMITGIDLAKEQIKIAAGEKLSIKQEDVKINGWAIECRINAEDPLNDFTPTPGRIKKYRSPGGPGIRVDSGVHTGYVISPYYDSMISKLVAWGRTRDEAIERMKRALYEYVIVGVTTNIAFHHTILNHEEFISGNLTTHFIEDHDISAEVKIMAEKLSVRGATLASALSADPKVAAISAAVGAYVAGYRHVGIEED